MMNPRLTACLAAAALLLLTGLARQQAGKGDGERLERLLDKTIQDVKPLAGLTAQPMGRLLARTSLSRASLDSIRLYDVRIRGELGTTRAAFLDVSWRGGKSARIGVAVNTDGGQHGPAAFDEFGKPQRDLEPFLSQFQGRLALGLSDASLRPLGETIRSRDAILAEEKAPPKQAERKRWSLLHHHHRMMQAEGLMERLEAARDNGESLRQPLRELAEHADELERFATNLKTVMEPKEVGAYRKYVKALGKATRTAMTLADKGKMEAAGNQVRDKIKRACSRCHTWEENHWELPLEEALLDELAQVGFARGSFVVGVDVRPFDLEPEDAQALAGAVKAALLLVHDKKE